MSENFKEFFERKTSGILKESTTFDFKSKEGIEAWLKSMKVKMYMINEDLTVDVKGPVNISRKGLTEIPIQFGTVVGEFDCCKNKLTSLAGCPKSMKLSGNLVSFNCSENKLTTLDVLPKFPKDGDGLNFNCSKNKLTTLKGYSLKKSSLF